MKIRWAIVLGVVVFTVVEVVSLIGWLALADAQSGIYDILGLLGIVVLFLGLSLEHIVTDNVLRSRSFLNVEELPLGEILTFSAIETGIWVVWLALSDLVDPVAGVAFLTVGLFFEHTISKNVHERRPIFSSLFNVSTLLHTVVEVAACTLWLRGVRTGRGLAGAGILLVGSLIEHAIAVRGTSVTK